MSGSPKCAENGCAGWGVHILKENFIVLEIPGVKALKGEAAPAGCYKGQGHFASPKPWHKPWERSRDQILRVVRKTLSRLWWNKKHFLICGAVHPAEPRGKSDLLWVLNIPSFHGRVNTRGWGLCFWDSSGGFPRVWIMVNCMDFIPCHLKSLMKAKLRNQGPKLLSFHLAVEFWKLHLF